MGNKGFAIRCPRCSEWNVQSEAALAEVAVHSAEEIRNMLRAVELKGTLGEQQTSRYADKLWRCRSPRCECPASFEAFVCRSEQDAFEFLEATQAWSSKRDFRLYKADCENRWDNKDEGKYYGILLNALPVPRLRQFELELLIDRELLSRAILGMSYEMQAPVTVFAANIFEVENKEARIYWMPIEAYSSSGEVLIPMGFNKFCRTCRTIVMEKLRAKFDRNQVSVSNCPKSFGKEGKCAGREAACMKEPKDWNHCPAFMEERANEPCYDSDMRVIHTLLRKWQAGEAMNDGLRLQCNAGFTEIAFPIEVHGHLVGVAMTGQQFFHAKEICGIDAFVQKWKVLEGCENELEKSKQELIAEEHEAGETSTTRFLTTEVTLTKKIRQLERNVGRLAQVGRSRYSALRSKSESAFREEVLGRILISKPEADFFEAGVLDMLERMRVFWAFQGSYLIGYSYKTKDIGLIAENVRGEGKAFGIPGKIVANVTVQHRQMHPCPFQHVMGEPYRKDRRIDPFLPVIEKIICDSGLNPSRGEYEFGVLIPFSDEVYVFVFAVRNENALCSLAHRARQSVSALCGDGILQSSTEVIHEFGDIWYHQANERAWAEFSALASHRIGNEITAAGALVLCNN